MTFPGKPFRAEESGPLFLPDLLQSLKSPLEGIGFHIGEIPPFSEPSQLFPKIVIIDLLGFEAFLKTLPRKMRKSAGGKAPDIDPRFNPMFFKEGEEFLKGSIARP